MAAKKRASEHELVLALDCGTTGNRAIAFDRHQTIAASSYREFTQHYPRAGWVEHDALEIWESARSVMAQVIKKVGAHRIAAVGVTNQRETVVLWDRHTGKPLARAIVWQCRRTAGICADMKKKGLETEIHRLTGLFLDPYFSASKILWLSRTHAKIREGLKSGDVLCGTIDTWIIWKLTGGGSFSTDPTNASRTMLYNLATRKWDLRLLSIFGVPMRSLPEILPSLGQRGALDIRLFGRAIPIAGVAGDQQSASFAQGCWRPGVVKNTYGTGLFLVAETGSKIKLSERLVTTAAVSADGGPQNALEGSVFIGGAAVQWLRDGLKVIRSAEETLKLARSLTSNEGVYFVPALAGLGCPHWDAEARGLLIGLTRQTTGAHLARAALESMAYQTRDVLDALARDTGVRVRRLSVDGGAVKNDFLMQFQADIAGCEVERPVIIETTALGAAGLAGIATGLWKNKEDFLKSRRIDRIFTPKMDARTREALYARWKKAVERAKRWEPHDGTV